MQDPNRFDNGNIYNMDSHHKRRHRSGGGCGGCMSVVFILILAVLIFLGIARYNYISPMELLRYYAEELHLTEYYESLKDYLPEDLRSLTGTDGSGKSRGDNASSQNGSDEPSAQKGHGSGASGKPSDSSENSDSSGSNGAISEDELKDRITNWLEGTGDITDESQSGYYCYNLLSDKEKGIYREILDAITHWKERDISTLDTDELNKIYNYVMADHPEIFYTNGVHYTQKSINNIVTSISVKGQYTMSQEEASQYQNAILPAVQTILASVPGYADGTTTDDFTKIKYLYDYIINSTDYEAGADENQNIISVFLNHRSVCNGYAKAMQYLSQFIGIPCLHVSGTAEGGPHAWNVIFMDGAWYQVDVTFGESNVSSGNTNASFINYAYLGLTDKEMYVNHTIDNTIPVPSCTATEDNYYIYTGTYFTDADIDTIGRMAEEAQMSGKNVIQFKVSDAYTMTSITDKLFNQHLIYNYLNNVNSCSYSMNVTQKTIVILF